MQWTLEVVQVPVADVEEAKEFYGERLGFAVDIDVRPDAEHRFVQLTPPGSGCSVQLSAGYHDDLVPGSLRGLVLVVPDVRAAQEFLAARGVQTSGVVVTADGESFRPARDDDALDDVGFVHFADPDGNRWSVQQISGRAAATFDLAVTRVVGAPPGEVWRTWTEPDRVMRWWGPTGFTAPSAAMDVRVGGRSLVCMRAPAEYGGQDMYNTWTYRAVVAPHRLQYDLAFTDAAGEPLDAGSIPPGVPHRVPHVVELRPLADGRTELTVRESGYTTAEARDISRAGLEQCLDKLAALHRA